MGSRIHVRFWKSKDMSRVRTKSGPPSPASPMSPTTKVLQDADGILAANVERVPRWCHDVRGHSLKGGEKQGHRNILVAMIPA